jgi:hypothetical protein
MEVGCALFYFDMLVIIVVLLKEAMSYPGDKRWKTIFPFESSQKSLRECHILRYGYHNPVRQVNFTPAIFGLHFGGAIMCSAVALCVFVRAALDCL